MQKEYKLTLLEHEVLSYLANKQYLYIARDEDGDLFVYKEKPIKNLNYCVQILKASNLHFFQAPY